MLTLWVSGKMRKKTPQKFIEAGKKRALERCTEKPETQIEQRKTPSKGILAQRHKVGCNS